MPLVILKKGWLHKLSNRGKGWKKRYVEITDNFELRYGREIRAQGTPNAKTTMYELKGVISLEDAHIVEVSFIRYPFNSNLPPYSVMDQMKASQLRVDGHEDRFPFIFKVSSQRRSVLAWHLPLLRSF